MSLPSRERGLKSQRHAHGLRATEVAPFTGAWIEIAYAQSCIAPGRVAPFTGAWIEITIHVSHPRLSMVAPFTGAWIEIGST